LETVSAFVSGQLVHCTVFIRVCNVVSLWLRWNRTSSVYFLHYTDVKVSKICWCLPS